MVHELITSLCRKDLRGLYAFAESALASMADDLAARVHDMPGLLAGATAELSATEVTNKPSRPHDPAEEDSGEGEVPASVGEELREQLSALAADCLEAQRLRDHWHSQYTAQVPSPMTYSVQTIAKASHAMTEVTPQVQILAEYSKGARSEICQAVGAVRCTTENVTSGIDVMTRAIIRDATFKYVYLTHEAH